VVDTIQQVHVVARSGNRKTGDIPVTYRPKSTCPTTCPFLPGGEHGGCYGTGRLFASADKYAGEVDVNEAADKIRQGMNPDARILRDRVVGDVLTPDGQLDRDYITNIVQIATVNRLTAFGYTHAWRDFTLDDLAFLRRSGYVMNASTETPGAAGAAALTRLPVVIVNDTLPEGSIVAGKRVVTCPAETREGVTCSDCGLCANPKRNILIRFTTHGTAVAKARAAIADATQKEAA
jgi:hypothetical protein